MIKNCNYRVTQCISSFQPQVAQLDQELVRVTALQVVFDLLQKFGLEAFKVNASVPELESSDASTSGCERDTSEKGDDGGEENEDKEDDSEKRDDENEEESQVPDTDTAASVLTILTGILESEVRFSPLNILTVAFIRTSCKCINLVPRSLLLVGKCMTSSMRVHHNIRPIHRCS